MVEINANPQICKRFMIDKSFCEFLNSAPAETTPAHPFYGKAAVPVQTNFRQIHNNLHRR
jgi:hypothetical protein